MERANFTRQALALATQQGCSGLLVTDEGMRLHLTGFRSSLGYLLLTNHGNTLFLDGRYMALARAVLNDPNLSIEPLDTDRIVSAVKKAGVAFLGTDCLPDGLEKRLRLELSRIVPSKYVNVASIRRVKEPDEIDLISEACVLTDRTFARFREGIRKGMDETDLHFLWRRSMLDTGGMEKAFDPIIAIDSGSSYPHYMLMRDQQVGEESIILVDTGVDAGGYKSDMTRMLFGPRATPRITEAYAKLRDIQEKVLIQIQPGGAIRETAAYCDKLLEEAGYAGKMMHSLGHGVGLEVHEEPYYRKDGTDVWEENMVIAVEPGIYFPGDFGLRIEDTVVVKEGGVVSLTRTPKDLQKSLLWVQ